jgi:peptidoglycan/LPS O-acetylase OafA/YrhL
LRMALAFAVFVHHTTIFNIGMSAVLVFFVLSGYWVAAMWTETYSKTRSAYSTYLISRIWRVAPDFALCSAISWMFLFWRGEAPDDVGGWAHQIFSNILILGYNSLPYQANIPGWSLDMEMQFYIIAPVIIFLVAKNLSILVLFVLITIFSHWLGGSSTVAPFLLFFGAGVASAVYDLKPDRNLAYSSLFSTLAMLFISMMLLIKDVALGELHGADLVAFSNKTSMLVAAMLTPWALYTTRQASGVADRMLGDLSYIFYLLHWSVIGALKTGQGSYAYRIFLCFQALLIIFAASLAIWRLFDRPLNRLRAAWVASRRLPA